MSKRIIICPGCGEEKPHRAKGLCQRCYNEAYYTVNCEKAKARSKAYHAANPEYQKVYYDANPGKNAERKASRKDANRRYYLKNVEYHEQYAEEHKEKIADYHKQWYKDNPEYGAIYAKRYAEEHKEEIYRRRRLPESLILRAAYDKQYQRDNPKEERDYVTRARQCSQSNRWFEGCERHHINPDTIIHIPAEMHRSIWHNMRTGAGMNDINRLAFAFLNGQRNASAQMTISDF